MKDCLYIERLVQLKKIQQTHCQINEKNIIIKKMMKHVMKIRQELEFFYQKQLSSESKTHQDLVSHSLENLFKQIKIDHFRSHTHINS